MNWQLALTLVCVFGAVYVLARRLRAFARGSSSGGCGPTGCGNCPTSSTTASLGQPRPFVSLESLKSTSGTGDERLPREVE